MATLTHAQYNSPMSLYSRENVQEVLNQVTGYPARPHSSQSGSFDPSQSHVYRYLQSDGQLPPAHSARYDDAVGSDHPRYRGFVDPNVQSPSFKRLQYVTGVDSGTEDEISHEIHPPPRSHTEEHHYQSNVSQTQQSQQSQAQPIALGYAPVGGQQQQGGSQQEQYVYQSQQQTTHSSNLDGPPVAQRDPTADESERDHPLDPTFAARIAEAERPKVPPPVVPSWTRFAEKKQERWQQHTGGHSQSQPPQVPQAPRNVQYYRPPQPTQHLQPSYTLDSGRAAQDKWQAHYAPYRFETGATAVSQDRPRSRSAEPNYLPGRRYGGNREWMKPFIAPNLRFNYGDGFAPPSQPSYSPLTSARTYNISTTRQDYGQSGVGGPQYGAQGYSSSIQQQQTHNQSYAPAQPQTGAHTTSTYQYSSTSTQGGQGSTGTTSAPAPQPLASSTPSLSKDAQSHYSRTVYESRREGGTSGGYQPQQQAVTAPWTGSQTSTLRTDNTQTRSLFQSEEEARRQRQLMEQEVIKRAASVGSGANRQAVTTTVSSRPPSQDNRVTTYSTTTGPPAGPRWQQAPGAETKSQSSGSYVDAQGNLVNYTKEVYTSSDPGKEFSMLTEQEKKILEEPLQPGVISRHITTKYYKKSTFTSTTTTSTSQTPPVTTTTRQAITSGAGRQF